jgi:predicted metal-dependent enzyme (double-stranded beta helix superfamily)
MANTGTIQPRVQEVVMTQVATYTLEAFIDDVKQIFASSKDPLVQAKAVAEHMADLLAIPGWLEEKLELPAEGGYGRYTLYLDEERGHPSNGWWLMCTVQKPGQDNLPHDHGNTWVVYGVYKGAIEQHKWRWFYPGEGVDSPQIKQTGEFVQRDGKVAFFMPGEIHHTVNVENGRSLVVRLESQKLDRVIRYQYDPEKGTVTIMDH